MKKLLVLFIWLFAISFAWGQSISNVDFDEIKVEIKDSTSKYYYPKLKKKICNQDSSLTVEEYHHLYYGNVFQKYYQPYGISHLKKSLTEEYKIKDYDKVFEIGLQVLEENPVDLNE